jgi:hypothetical protein
MKLLGIAVVVGLLIGVAGPAAAQLTPPIGSVGPSSSLGLMGTPNPTGSVFIIRPSPTGPFVVVPPGTPFSRETFPFGDEPNRSSQAHPMMPYAGLGYAVRQHWVPPQPVQMQVYVPAPAGIPASYQTQVAQVPGFFVTETTTGYVYPERWVIDQLNVGVYQWRKVPVQFVPR